MTEPTSQRSRPWWADAVIYQIYIRSFQDTDHDGIGDLAGVIARLDHLVFLGVDALWLSPFHPSPMLDGGYDIADFFGVDPRFGDLETFDRLVAEAHQRGLKVIIDFVPNHTSDQHPWFVESRASTDNPKRDWYVWQDGKDAGPPNNWESMMEGPAWTRDPATGQFYYHAFLPEQPDLNWRNPAVRDAMADALRFWLARGVDGVRVDAVPHLVEDALLRDDLPEAVEAGMPVQGGLRHVYTSNRPENIAVVAELRRVVDEFPDRVMIGEAHLPMPMVMRYLGTPDQPGLHAPFNFTLLEAPWNTAALGAGIDIYLGLLPAGVYPNWLVGNHDELRVASRVGSGQVRVAAMLALTLGGAAFIYNGEELGLEDVPFTKGDLRDVPEMTHPDHALQYAPHRTPMPWDGGPQGGFTSGVPWLALGPSNQSRNVVAQTLDDGSVLALYRRLIALRRSSEALASGAYRPLRPEPDQLAFLREAPGERVLVVLNLAQTDTSAAVPEAGMIVLSTDLDRENESCTDMVTLRPNEGLVIRLG